MCSEEVLEFRVCSKEGEVGLVLEVAWERSGRWWLWKVEVVGCLSGG